MLRGCSLKNTEWVDGIVIFTGHDTKLMQNSAKASHKFSRLETAANLCIIVILALQLLLAIVASLISANISVNDLTSVDWIEQTKDGSSTAIAWLII